MSRRISSVQRSFQQSLRSYNPSCRQSIPLNQKQDQEFLQICDILSQFITIIKTGDFNKFSQNVLLLMDDKLFPFKKHLTINVFIPKPQTEVGVRLLKYQEFWIVLVIFFEHFAKKGEIALRQFRYMIKQMKVYIDQKLCDEILDQAYIYCLNGGLEVNFLRGTDEQQVSDLNSNQAQCYSVKGSLFEDSIQVICQNNSKINEINQNDHQKATDENKLLQQDQVVEPYIQTEQQKQIELDELIKEDQERHQQERDDVNNEYSQNSQFYSLQNSFIGQKKRQSRTLRGLNIDDKELLKLGSGYMKSERKSKSTESDSQNSQFMRRYSRRVQKKANVEEQDKIVEQKEE